MSRRKQVVNVVAVVVPLASVCAAVPLLWHHLVGPRDLAIFAVFYVFSGLGIALGYHRLLSHRAFKTYPAFRALFAYAGALALQGPPIEWVADHRLHHSHSDDEGDPHSPHTHGGDGWWATIRGLAHAHVGWMLWPRHTTQPVRYAPDLLREPAVRWISRHYLAVAISGLVLPAAVGGVIGGTSLSALTGLLWGGIVRVLLQHHVTWSVNSICHVFGTRRFETTDYSRNQALLVLPSLGEAWHNNHHAFPTSARHGMAWYELDPAYLLLLVGERLGIFWDLVRISPERLESKRVDRRAELTAAG